MGFFDKLFGSGKIKVEFINNASGAVVGITEMSPDQLPQTFSIATTMHLGNEDWTVEEAIPENSAEFIKTKSLVLKLRKVEYIDPKKILFTLPTISSELPPTASQPAFNDFEILIREDDWRQSEFLNRSSFGLIDIEVSKIENIWKNHKKETNGNYNAFDKCHVRDTIGKPGLNLDLQKIKQLLSTEKTGSLKINDEYVQNAFSLQTPATAYYGILDVGKITHLCISDPSENTITEINRIIKEFDLVFVNWYHPEIIEEPVE
jgi:hypothetical protein